MGQIRQRGGVWQIRYYRNGKRYEESVGKGKGKTDAKNLLKQKEGDIAKGIPVTPQRYTVADAFDAVRVHYRLKQRKSLDSVERRITLHLAPHFGRAPLASLTTDGIAAYATGRLDAGASPATVNRELAVLKLAFSLAVKARRVLWRPHIEMLTEDNARQGFFDAAQLDAVCRQLPSALVPVVRFAAVTGWRKSEILGLTWDRVDFARGIVRLDPGTTKNGRGRVFAFGDHPQLAALLTAQRTHTDAVQRTQGRIIASVFHRNGKPVKRFDKAWTSACVAAGCPGRLIHDLRRTAVRNLIRAGVSEQTAMTVSGHQTRNVFDRYNIQSDADIRDAARKLATGTP